jgi:hypothetical protein
MQRDNNDGNGGNDGGNPLGVFSSYMPGKKWIVLGVLAVGLISLFIWASKLKTEGVHHESALTAQYSSDQNEYSNYGAALVEQLGVADEKKDAVIEIIAAYVSGRKSEGSGKLVTMVKEAVPDLGSTAIYDKIVDYIQKGREQFKNKQDALLNKVAAYDNWRNEGLIRPLIIEYVLHFPTQNLRAQVGNNSVTGQAALDKMRVIVTTSDSQKTFETGTDKPFINRKPKDKGGKAEGK